MSESTPVDMIKGLLQPWMNAIASPYETQREVLHRLLTDYSRTKYGIEHNASNIDSIEDYRRNFPINDYDAYKPLIKDVMKGEVDSLMCEQPIGWAITRGTTQVESKFIPMTPTDLRMRVSAGRAMLNYVLESGRFDLFLGVNLNLNFPSRVGTLNVGNQELEYGYSSGIYTRFVSQSTPIQSCPSQEEIDALGGGKTTQDWNRRFELAYSLCRDKNVTLVGGVCPTAIKFACYLKQIHHIYPKNVWQTQIMTLGSIPGINTNHEPALQALYGNAVIREIYGTTEGMFGQQKDEKRAWTPNYDLFFFEVMTTTGVKMLHEMKPGEMGSLVVSTPILPRYRIGDLILAMSPPYFRCIGRERWWTPWYYYWNEIASLNFNRL